MVEGSSTFHVRMFCPFVLSAVHPSERRTNHLYSFPIPSSDFDEIEFVEVSSKVY